MAEPSFSDVHFHAGWRMPTLLYLFLVTIISGCVGLSERTGQISIDRSFTTSGFGWDSGSIVYVFLKVRENQGKVEVCAAHMAIGGTGTTDELNRDVLDAASATVDGARVIQGLAFANRLPQMDDVIGQPANCARGTADWKPSYAGASVEVKIPRMKFVI